MKSTAYASKNGRIFKNGRMSKKKIGRMCNLKICLFFICIFFCIREQFLAKLCKKFAYATATNRPNLYFFAYAHFFCCIYANVQIPHNVEFLHMRKNSIEAPTEKAPNEQWVICVRGLGKERVMQKKS